MELKSLAKYFPMKLPIAYNGIFWNGNPEHWSNLPAYQLYMSQRFGMSMVDYSKFNMIGHNGVDIAGKGLTPIVAPIKLWTSHVQIDPYGYGNTIWAETETKEIEWKTYKLQLVFGHFQEISAKPYHWLENGSILGGMGTTGYSTGNHLHYGIRPLVRRPDGSWEQIYYGNGYLGYVDPEPFMPRMIWDYSELIPNPKNMDIDDFMKVNDLRWIQNSDTGEFAWIYNKKLRLAPSKDRAVLMNQAYLHRANGGITVNYSVWDKLPKANF